MMNPNSLTPRQWLRLQAAYAPAAELLVKAKLLSNIGTGGENAQLWASVVTQVFDVANRYDSECKRAKLLKDWPPANYRSCVGIITGSGGDISIHETTWCAVHDPDPVVRRIV